MDLYLVVIRCSGDDYPVRICRTRGDAEDVARELTEAGEVPKWFVDFWGMEGVFFFVSVVRFHDGVPAEMWDRCQGKS